MTAAASPASVIPARDPAVLPDDLLDALRTGRTALAEELVRRHLAKSKESPALLGLLGALRIADGRARDARGPLMLAIVLAPDHAEPAVNIALTYLAAGDLPRAHLWAVRAANLDPSADAWATCAAIERAIGSSGRASTNLRRAVALAPAVPDFHANRGNLALDRDAFDAATREFRRALAISPGAGNARFQLACIDLGGGRLVSGWKGYGARFDPPAMATRRPFPQPEWQGESLGGRQLLLWAEQGLAEEVIFALLLPDVLERTSRVVLECDSRLVSLLARTFSRVRVVGRRTPPDPSLLAPDVSHQLSLGGLPRLFRPTHESFASARIALQADSRRIATCRAWLRTLDDKPKVGIAWRSIRTDALARRTHTSLDDWTPILTTPGVTFVNLQYGNCLAEIEQLERLHGITLHRMPALDLFDDLDGAAALSASLDLAISTITSAHVFPAAAGVETWLLCPAGDYFRLGRDYYPWYPNARCFTRAPGGDWRAPVDEVAKALDGWRHRNARGSGP